MLRVVVNHQQHHSGKAHCHAGRDSPIKYLATKYQDFKSDCRDRQRGFDNGGHARSHVLLGPKQRAVGKHKHEQCDKTQSSPLPGGGTRLATDAHKDIQNRTRQAETQGGCQERWKIQNGNSNG
jgi:hypothetical protein